jgi:FkbM family methyltransferase
VKNPLFKRLSRRFRGRLKSKILAEHGIGVVAETKNGLLAVDPRDFNVSRALLKQGEYDWRAVSWLARLVNPGSRLVFAGAHIGAVLIPVLRGRSDCAALAFEPSPRNFRLLTLNVALNGLNGVTLRNVALGDKPGRLDFTENFINSGNSRILRGRGEIMVEVETLDHSVPPGWDSVDLVVMDVEGSEVHAMRGAAATLSRTRLLYAEFAPEQLHEQGSSAADFAAEALKHFESAYVFGSPVVFLGRGAVGAYLRELEFRRGLLVNILFTHDVTADPARMRADG